MSLYMYPIYGQATSEDFDRVVDIGCFLIPQRGEPKPKPVGETKIFRTSPQPYGTAEMIGYHIDGRAVNQDLAWYEYAGGQLQHIDHYNLVSPYTYIKEYSGYEWGWSQCVRVFPTFMVEISASNQQWYPGWGSFSAKWVDDGAYLEFRSYRDLYYPDVRGGSHAIYTSRDQYMIGLADFPTWSESRCLEYLQYIYATKKWYTGTFSMSYYKKVGDAHGSTNDYYLCKFTSDALHYDMDKVTPPRFGEQIVGGHVICQPDKLSLWRAYSNAIENLPTDDMNWIEGIVDVVNFIVDIITLNLADLSIDLAKMPKYAADVWLTWRYVINTTKADVEDISSTRSRVAELTRQLKAGNRLMTTHGEGSSPWGVCHVSLTYAIADVLELNNFIGYTERMLAYDAWDLIPFSFIVDWFYSVGDLLHDISIHNTAMKLQAQSAWYSYSYTDTSGGGQCKRYFRRRLNYVPGIPDDVSYVVDRNGDTRALKRSIDSLSILISSIF